MKKVILIFLVLFMVGCSSEPVWETIKIGEVERVEYKKGGFLADDTTIIYFKDGGVYTFPSIKDVPAKTIKILHYSNAVDHYKILPEKELK